MKKSLFTLLLLVCPALAGAAEITGRVLSSGGTPIEHARIDVVDGDGSGVFTNMRGEFVVRDVEPPLQLVVTHPRFFFAMHDVEDAANRIELKLEPKQEIYEAIAVTANPGEENFSPVSVAISVLDPEKLAAPPNSLTEFVSATPSVSENGQGGLFQTYSVRGVSRLRVMTLVSGMRIVGERRAGVSASFIDPLLMDSVDVVPWAACCSSSRRSRKAGAFRAATTAVATSCISSSAGAATAGVPLWRIGTPRMPRTRTATSSTRASSRPPAPSPRAGARDGSPTSSRRSARPDVTLRRPTSISRSARPPTRRRTTCSCASGCARRAAGT